MKAISSHSRRLNVRLFLPAVSALFLCAGCVGHRELLTLSNSLQTSSQAAAVQIGKLQEAAGAEVQAHNETRESFRKVFTAWRLARAEVARANMTAAYQKMLVEINQGEIKTLQDMQSRRLEMRASLDEKLSVEIVPLDEKEATLKLVALQASEKAAKLPGDLDLRSEKDRAELAYLALGAKSREIELVARKAGIKALDEGQLEVCKKIELMAQNVRERVGEIYQKAIAAIPAIDEAPLDLGAEPSANIDSYQGLIAYSAAVTKAGDTIQDYLRSNSFGRGSLFQEFWSSLGKGILGGIVKAGNGKGVSFSEAGAAGKDLLGTFQEGFKEQLAAAKETMRSSLSDTVSDGVKLLETKLNTALSPKIKPL